jgi:hypothetical protein
MVGKCYDLITSKQANTYLNTYIDVSKILDFLDSICEGSNAMSSLYVCGLW